MCPLAPTKEQRQKHIEIWGKVIERKKRESKKELRNLQCSVNYGNIKASSRCRRDKANRWVGCLGGVFVDCSLALCLFFGFFGCCLGLFAG
jgi:hypothetical protein